MSQRNSVLWEISPRVKNRSKILEKDTNLQVGRVVLGQAGEEVRRNDGASRDVEVDEHIFLVHVQLLILGQVRDVARVRCLSGHGFV